MAIHNFYKLLACHAVTVSILGKILPILIPRLPLLCAHAHDLSPGITEGESGTFGHMIDVTGGRLMLELGSGRFDAGTFTTHIKFHD